MYQLCALLWHVTAENPANINQRVAAANHTNVVWAVADNIALSAQHGILQRDGIERSDRRKVYRLRLLHHSPREEVLLVDHSAGDPGP